MKNTNINVRAYEIIDGLGVSGETKIDNLAEKVKDYDKIKAEYPELAFEKIERLKNKLAINLNKLEEIRPKFQEEHNKNPNNVGKYSEIKLELIDNVEKLKKEIVSLIKETRQNSDEFLYDPVKKVKERYERELNEAKLKVIEMKRRA